jgi:hypothetical protein
MNNRVTSDGFAAAHAAALRVLAGELTTTQARKLLMEKHGMLPTTIHTSEFRGLGPYARTNSKPHRFEEQKELCNLVQIACCCQAREE